MDTQDDLFTVFLRDAGEGTEGGTVIEEPVATLPSYEEARRVCQTYQQRGQACVIRFSGAAGGGD